MKKKYTMPELELVMFRLKNDVLVPSIEQEQTLPAGGGMDDPPEGDDILEEGGFWL